jgi:hypothetical protein
MKLIDRIRPIADSPEYAEFAERWRRFVDAGHTGYPGHVSLMLQKGTALEHQVMERAAEHAKAQVRSPFSFTEALADLLVLEAQHGADRAMRKLMPELAAYAAFITATLRERTVQPPTEAL